MAKFKGWFGYKITKNKKSYGFGEREVECHIHLNIDVECSRCGKKLYNTV